MPHPPDAAGKALEGTAVGRDVTEGMPSGRRQRTRKRGDWLEELLREVIRQAVMDRVDPRWDRNAEAHWPTKGSREAGQERMELLNRPTKGDLTLTTARKRRLTKPRGSPFGASRPRAVPEGRQLRKKDRRVKARRPSSTDLDRSTDTQEVFGKRWPKV